MSNFRIFEFSKYYVIFIYFQAAVSALLDVSFVLTLKKNQKDVRSPDARLSLVRLSLARLRLNDGAKLWVSFKLCFKTNDFYGTYWRIILKIFNWPNGYYMSGGYQECIKIFKCIPFDATLGLENLLKNMQK